MNKILVLMATLAIGFGFFGCGNESLKEGSFRIEGKVNFLRNGYVRIMVRQGEQMRVLDSTQVSSDSTFVLRGNIDNPAFAQIDFYQKQKEFIPLTEGVIEVVADGNAQGGMFEATGTQELLYMAQVKKLHDQLMEDLEGDRQIYTLAYSRGDYPGADSIQADMDKKVDNHHQAIMDLIDEIGTSSLTGVYAMNLLDYRRVFDFLDAKSKEIAAKENPMPHEIEYLSNFNNNRARMLASIEEENRRKEIEKQLRMGAVFPDITLPNPEGNDQSLSSLKGKVVLVDFWAGWCRPCRAENPNLVAAYNKYNSKGFEIFGVSLDSNKKQWVEAIEKDGLTWTQVSDLLHWNSIVVKEYNISSIPANYLLDREGKIIAMNLRGPALESKLDEVM